MVEQGVVAEAKNGMIMVEMKRHAACGACRACGMAEGRLMRIEFANDIGARPGDTVNIELDDSAILKGAALFYAAPLLGLVAGVFLGSIFSELTGALCGAALMITTFFAAKRLTGNAGFKPKVSKA